MVDRDVIMAVQEEFGGTVCSFRRKDRPQNKQVWQWALPGIPAANLMIAMYPYLFERRREQIDQALATWAAGRYQFDPELKTFRRGCEGDET
jgi:hypothetical protein